MDLPTLMPTELAFLSGTATEWELRQVIFSLPSDRQVLFLQAASEDETWSERHAELLRDLLGQLAQSFAKRKLSSESLRQVAHAVRLHRRVLSPCLPQDLEMEIRGRRFLGCSILYGEASRYFRELIQSHEPPGELLRLELGSASVRVFALIQEYVETGSCLRLQTESKEELLEDLLQAVEWGIEGLRADCIAFIRHYIDPDNAVELLTTSQYYHLADLRQACCDRWNHDMRGALLESQTDGELALVVSSYHAREVAILEQVAPLATRLAFRSQGAENPLALNLLQRCRRLRSLDLSETIDCPQALLDAAPAVTDLRLASCGWLEDELLKELLKRFHDLQRLDLSDDVQITDKVWFSLSDYPSLTSLRLSHCHQVRDAELDILLTFVGVNLLDLDLSWCQALTDQAVHLILHRARRLMYLDLSHLPKMTDRGAASLPEITPCAQCASLDAQGCRMRGPSRLPCKCLI